MPIYVYQVVQEDGSEGEVFEVEQPMSDPPLQHHPHTGEVVRRVYQPPNLSTRYGGEGTAKSKLENKNVEKAGFTKYEKDKLTGKYHRVAGRDKRAPDVLQP